MNTDDDNYISENEFLLFCVIYSTKISEGEMQWVRELFTKYDPKKTGKIDLNAFKNRTTAVKIDVETDPVKSI